MTNLRAVLFGKPAVYWQREKLVFPFAKMEALLYYLLVAGEATRESLATLLWGNMDDNAAKQNLRNTIYLLKKTVSADLLTSSRLKVALNPQLDVTTGLELLTPADIAEFLEQHSGEFLADFYCKDAPGFDDWVGEKREQFRKTSIRCLTKRVIELMQHEDYAAAKKDLQRLIRLDEYNESAYRLLMKIYAKVDVRKVMETYQKLERKLAAELGLAPSAKTQEIYLRLRSQKGSAGEPGPAGPGDQRFFGRGQELRQLQQRLNAFYDGEHRKNLILLQGEQGVGKLAIIEELLLTVYPRGSLVFRTQCYQAELDYMYKAWNHVYLQTIAFLHKAGVALPALWQQVIAYIFPAAAGDEKWLPADSRADVFQFNVSMIEEIMSEVLAKAAAAQKIVLVIKDIHWLDKQGWSLLWQVLHVHGDKIFCLATCHTEYARQINTALAEFERNGMVEDFTVRRFSRQDVMQLAAMRLPGLSGEMQSRLYDYTGGNALFLNECLNLLAEGKDISQGSIRLHTVLKERISNLSVQARKVLEIASVFFDNVQYEMLLSIAAINELELIEALEELQQKRLLLEAAAADGDGVHYTFYNWQLRDYVYRQMSTVRQRMLHKLAALYLERQLHDGIPNKDAYEHIVYHYTVSDEKLKIIEYTIRLTEEYYCPQYEMYPELNPYYAAGYVDFRENRTQTAACLDKIGGLLEWLTKKISASDQLQAYQIAYWEMAGRYYIWRGEHRRGLRLIHRMLRLTAANHFRDYRIKGYQQIIYCGIQTRRPLLIRRFALKLLRLTERDIPDKKATALRFLGVAYALRRRYRQAEKYYRHSLALFKKLAVHNRFYAFTIAAANNYIGDLRRETFDYQAALAHYELAIRIAGREQVSEGVALFYINAGYTAFLLRDDAKATAYLEDALALADGFGNQKGYWCLRGYCTLNCVLALIALRRQRWREAKRHWLQATDFLKTYQDPYQRGLILCTQAEIRLLMRTRKEAAAVFAGELTLPAAHYYEQARTIFRKLGRTAELASLEEMMAAYAAE